MGADRRGQARYLTPFLDILAKIKIDKRRKYIKY
jgi:hypothetical protein